MKHFVITLLLVLLCSACAPSEDVVQTSLAQTQEAVPTDTQTPVPPTNTPLPAPTLTPTPAPLIIQDDFSSKSDIWGDCEKCEWKDDALFFGPFPPNKSGGQDQLFYVICEACGKYKYYRMAVDVTASEGYSGDRTYGLLAGLTDNNYLGAATITSHQHVLYETFDFNTLSWGGTPFELYKEAVQYGEGATNRIEVEAKPTVIVVRVNGIETVSFKQPAEPVQVGLYLGWHSVGVKYDNFEFEEWAP